jgi:hypothetical protein
MPTLTQSTVHSAEYSTDSLGSFAVSYRPWIDHEGVHAVDRLQFRQSTLAEGRVLQEARRIGVLCSRISKEALMDILRARTWLGDDQINAYLGMLVERSVSGKGRRCIYFSSFFVLISQNSSVQKLLREVEKRGGGESLESVAIVFFPLNISLNHWVLLVLDLEFKEIRVYDSRTNEDTLVHTTYFEIAWQVLATFRTMGQAHARKCGFDPAMFEFITRDAWKQHRCLGASRWTHSAVVCSPAPLPVWSKLVAYLFSRPSLKT